MVSLVLDGSARRGLRCVLRCGILGVIGKIRRSLLFIRPLGAQLPAEEHDDRDQEGGAYHQWGGKRLQIPEHRTPFPGLPRPVPQDLLLAFWPMPPAAAAPGRAQRRAAVPRQQPGPARRLPAVSAVKEATARRAAWQYRAACYWRTCTCIQGSPGPAARTAISQVWRGGHGARA